MWYSWFIMIQPISVLPHLLNWIIFWIEFFWNFLNWIIFWIEFLWKILNWIIFWIEFSWNTIELNIELNNFLAKFKYWIESVWVSLTPSLHQQDQGEKNENIKPKVLLELQHVIQYIGKLLRKSKTILLEKVKGQVITITS